MTPHLDRLASQGMIFERAYCQQALCRPSRASLLSGLRPDSTGVHDLDTVLREARPDAVTLPQHFRQHGYRTAGIGKIFHADAFEPEPASWSEPFIGEQDLPWVLPGNRELVDGQFGPHGRPVFGPPTEQSDSVADEHPDGRIASAAEAALDRFAGDGWPFFLAVGFVKPHLPFAAPSEYWDRTDPREIGDPDPLEAPEGAPEYALTNYPELRVYQGMPGSNLARPSTSKVPLTRSQTRQLRRGYLASVSFVDEQIGRVLRRLEELGLDEDTVVVIVSDHGYKLGEYGEWTKQTNFELDVRSLLMVRPAKARFRARPNVLTDSAVEEPPVRLGLSSDALVELVDVFPTVCELAGVPLLEGLEGTSVVPLLRKPRRAWKSAAFSQFPRGGVGVVGRTIRTESYRLTEWSNGADRDDVEAVELYDHRDDDRESINVANRPEHAATVEELRAQLRAGWRAALPPEHRSRDGN